MSVRLKDMRGFTLTELMVTVGVLGVMAAFAMPNLIAWKTTIGVNSAARDLISEMQVCRMKAVSERNNYVITFDATNNQYTVHDDNDSDGILDEVGSNASNGDESSKGPIDLPDDIRFGRASGGINIVSSTGTNIDSDGIHVTGDTLTFEPDGTPTSVNTESVYIIPTNDDESNEQRTHRWRAISVNVTGRIKLWTYDGDLAPPWE
ncbi:MAG: GspH/FimT family pseudopilin [Thermodesulfobacteriota bacterium]|nr:GspH/FimT family pseudopilin [Thermodesulfobacteriota bacterium]